MDTYTRDIKLMLSSLYFIICLLAMMVEPTVATPLWKIGLYYLIVLINIIIATKLVNRQFKKHNDEATTSRN